jgi:hypothetical protein
MNTSVKHVKEFIQFAAKELGLSSLPKISLVGSQENSKNAFGHFLGNRKGTSISVRITDRHPIDVMRTLAHELIHFKQKLSGVHSSEQMREDEANALAGRIMRKYDTTYPGVFKDKPIREEIANVMGDSSSSSGPIVTVDPFLMKKPLNRIVKTKKLKDIEESGNGIFHKKALFADGGHKKKPMKDRFSGKTDFNKMMKDEDGEEKADYTMGKKIRVGQ